MKIISGNGGNILFYDYFENVTKHLHELDEQTRYKIVRKYVKKFKKYYPKIEYIISNYNKKYIKLKTQNKELIILYKIK